MYCLSRTSDEIDDLKVIHHIMQPIFEKISKLSDCSRGWPEGSLDLYITILSVKQGGFKYYFWVFSMTRPRIEPIVD